MTPRRRPGRRPRVRPAFTLLETVLAAVLGTLVLTACMGLFTMLKRSDQRQIERLERTTQIARAHKTVARALQLLVMSDQTPPSLSKEQQELRDEEELDSVSGDNAFLPDPTADVENARLALQPDLNADRMNYRGGLVPPQSLRVTLRAPPVVGGRPTEEELGVDLSSMSMTVADLRREQSLRLIGQRPASSRAARRDPADDEDLDARRRRRREREDEASGNNDDDQVSASERTEMLDALAPRAPGVIGIFELHPDGAMTETGYGATKPPRITDPEMAAGWSLWWREVPPPDDALLDELAGLADEDDLETDEEETGQRAGRRTRRGSDRDDRREEEADAGQAAADRLRRQIQAEIEQNDRTGKRVLLLSGLKYCRWEMFRKNRRDPKMLAEFPNQLPAYIELKFETLEGRTENWVFEVGWSNGPLPGTRLEQAQGRGAPANQPDPNPQQTPTGQQPIPPIPTGEGAIPTLPAEGNPLPQ